jgi:hypothetical protein
MLNPMLRGVLAVIKKLLEIASGEVGYLEKKSNASLDDFTANAGTANYTKYARDYAAWGWGNYQGQPWCDVFVSWCFKTAFNDDLVAGHNSYCPSHVNWFKARSRWHTGNPQAGGVIFFKDSSGVACHVGIVEKVDNLRVYTIEGNTSSAAGVVANGGAVARKSYGLSYGSILGYGRPDYGSEDLKSEEDIMFDELIAKYGRDAVKSAVEDLIVAREIADWKVKGSDWLHAAAQLSSVHNQNEPVTFGTLGTVLEKLK